MALITSTMLCNYPHYLFPKLFITPNRKQIPPWYSKLGGRDSIVSSTMSHLKGYTGFKNSPPFLWHLLSLWWVWMCKTNTLEAVTFSRVAKAARGWAARTDLCPNCCACRSQLKTIPLPPLHTLFSLFLSQQQKAWHALVSVTDTARCA